ncbi:hypothetical protein K9M59_04235 [Candidatus Gracilibacteria bacterium]|nr:hypothetical protein [Candidatus Gracilibacteria bacterium]MCF7819529.1 hypothetical protein [Candidatus Gracilibacteria bacterium]
MKNISRLDFYQSLEALRFLKRVNGLSNNVSETPPVQDENTEEEAGKKTNEVNEYEKNKDERKEVKKENEKVEKEEKEKAEEILDEFKEKENEEEGAPKIKHTEAVPDATKTAEKQLISFENISLYYGSLEAQDAEDYKTKLVAEIQNDIAFIENPENSETEVLGMNMSRVLGSPDERKHRLERIFPKEMNDKSYDRIVPKVDQIDAAALWEAVKPLDYQGKDAEKYAELLDSVSNEEFTEEGMSEYAEKYKTALQNGYRGTFEQWDNAQPRSAIEKFARGMKKLFRILGQFLPDFMKDFLPEGIQKFLNLDTDESNEDKKNNTALKEANEWAQQQKNFEAWFKEGNAEMKKKFDQGRTEFHEYFSFLDGKTENLETDEEETGDYRAISPEDIQRWDETKIKDAEGKSLAINELVRAVKNGTVAHDAEGISKETFLALMEKADKIVLDNGQLKYEKREFGKEDSVLEASEKGWSNDLVTELQEAEADLTYDQELLRKVFPEPKKEFEKLAVEEKTLWEDDDPSAGKLKSVPRGIFNLDEQFWSGYQLTKEDLQNLARSGTEDVLDIDDDVYGSTKDNDYYTLKEGKLIRVSDGVQSSDLWSDEEIEGATINNGEEVPTFALDDVEAGGYYWNDTDFTDVQTFFTWLDKALRK